MKTVRIESGYAACMQAAGLVSYDDFSRSSVGELVSRDHKGRELRRLAVEIGNLSQVFYLKRIGREPFAKLAQMLLFGRWPCSGPVREVRMLQALQRAGFATMRQVAYGQKRVLGWPVGGFLVVEGVRGVEVAQLVETASPELRRRLFGELGAYLGRLHGAGFNQAVRLKDLFCSKVPQSLEDRFDFILIDRETSKPWKTRFSEKACFATLARTARRVLRDGFRPGHGELGRFLRGYLGAVGDRFRGMDPAVFRQALFKVLRRELGGRRSPARKESAGRF